MTKAFGANGGAQARSESVTVSFGERFAASQQFDLIFKEGMALVERTACYLDGAGRKDAKSLPRTMAVAYGSESMRLTTRLLEVASWLLVRRALKDGEITVDEARAKRRRMKLGTIGRPSHVSGFDQLPETMRQLIEASFALQDRIIQLDRAIEGGGGVGSSGSTGQAINDVGAQMSRIEAAFARS